MLNPVTPEFIAGLAASLPADTLRAADAAHLEEPRGKWRGQPGPLALPRSTAEVAVLVAACAKARVGVVPWGGGTGLVCGQVIPDGPLPLILSLERMTGLRGAYPNENVLVVEAGMILADVHAAAEKRNRIFPLSLASEGSCRIGGNLATNAGGLNVLRYGNTRDLCLGVEAVLPDGSIFNGLKRLRKDNTGYDLRHLLIGSEGSLGVITAASLRLFPKPAEVGTALFAVTGPAAALELLALAESHLTGMVQAFELIHRRGFDFLAEAMPEVKSPLQSDAEWFVLTEIGLPAGFGAANDHLTALFEQGLADGLVSDGVVASSHSQRAALWQIRESIPEANKRIGSISSHDISLPLSEIADFIAQAPATLARLGDLRINCFGHLGDGNLHYNVFPPKGRDRAEFSNLANAMQDLVHEMVVARGGSFSAEHGVGRLKSGDLERYGDPAKLAAMRAIKAALDPQGIMNPGAVLRA